MNVKISSVLVLLVLVGVSLCVALIIESSVPKPKHIAGDFEYTVSRRTVTITDYMGSATNVAIPVQIAGFPVTAIGDYAFAYNQLTGVTIPDGVTAIGDSAFANNLLTSVSIPDSVAIIGDYAFGNNNLTNRFTHEYTCLMPIFPNSLTSVSIPANVKFLYLNRISSLPPFPGNLAAVYIRGGSKAGTYISGDDERWRMK
ncbi:MAG: leucine-rich repeat domain-containing protein [Spirochaetaceae bacterium]|jgi:hypothetical protein|nr:leucine-rich repeat domain-containing protein [Spirochaetaceae bacterium]